MTARRPLIIGNWKMSLGLGQACALARDLKRRVASIYAGPETAVCPSPSHLIPIRDVLEGSVIALGAQDVAAQSPGAFTGAVSAEQLREIAVQLKRYLLDRHTLDGMLAVAAVVVVGSCVLLVVATAMIRRSFAK